MLKDFLENGPDEREERRQILMRNMVELHEEYKDFLDKRTERAWLTFNLPAVNGGLATWACNHHMA